MRTFFTIGLALMMMSSGYAAEMVDESCHPIKDCTPTRTCDVSINYDRRDCMTCLLRQPIFGGCIQRGNDPVCEAAKATRNSIYQGQTAAQKARCEMENASEKLVCETVKSQAVAVCLARKSSNAGSEDNYQKLLLLDGVQAPLPAKIIETLSSHDVYRAEFLSEIKVTRLENTYLVPPPFKDASELTVGIRIFVKPGVNVDDIPLRDWIRQIEFAKLYIDYGFNGMTGVLKKDAPAIMGLVDEKTSTLCNPLGC